MENYKFFRNTSCEYFPCHKTDDEKNFNCLFCFCPLYSISDCGGSFTYNESNIKCCDGCTIPHRKENYEMIIEKIKKYNEKFVGRECTSAGAQGANKNLKNREKK